MVSVNPDVLKKCFNLYEDQSLYNNYSKIANKYYKLFKENNNKKNSSDFQEKLREEVKKWLFNQSLENRMKICTVENELYGKILYRMILLKKMDRTMLFKPKPYFFPEIEENNEQFSKNINNINDYNYNQKAEDGLIYPPNNPNIKITKTNKTGKKTEAPKLGYSQSSLDGFNNEEILMNNFGNFFNFQSYRGGNFSLSGSNENSNLHNNENQKMIELCSEEFINNIIFFSVHHRYFPDCFTLSPEFLLEKEKFENSFYILGNKKYFCSLIQSDVISGNSKSQKLYTYKMPDWLEIKNNSEENDCLYSITQYAIAFFEQVIMIKYLLNKNDKKLKTYSLLDEQALNRFFSDRKMAINYMKKNYNNENKLNILNDLEIEKYYNNVMTNKEKIKYVDYYNKICHNEKFRNNPYIIDSILINPHSNKSEEKYNKMKNIQKPKYNKNELLNLEQIKIKITDIIKNNDIIYFIDYLLFQNYLCIWKNEYFLQSELFEKLTNLITEQNLKELIFDSKPTKSNKSKHRKKNKKNHNIIINNNSIQQNKIEEEKNNNNIQNEYEGIFKDEEEELYAPYYLKANTEQKKMYLKIKGNNIYDNNKDKEIIRQFISKDIILGLIIDNVFLTPLNSDLDFEKYKEDNFNSYKNDESKIYKVEDKKMEENEIIENDNEIKDNIDNNENNELNIHNNIIEEKKENQNIINDNNSNNIDIKSNNLNINNKETSNNNISKENDLENNDSLSLKSDNFSSEIDKSTTITINTNEEAIHNYKDNNKKNPDTKSDSINNRNINNNNNSKPKKKKEKEQTFFLFDTVKKKKKKNIHNSNNNALISNEFNIIAIKEPNKRLSFYDKLHNDIIKYETKVITLLNHGMKFKDYCIKEIKRIIQETFTFSNDYNVDIYGSYATGLMIEGSDIDIKIKLNNGNKSDLDNFFETLCKKLEDEKKFDKINPIGTASVPVIKLLFDIEKFIKGKDDLENSYKQYKELSLFKHYIFDTNELTRIKIDVTFILANHNNNNSVNSSTNNSTNNSINNEINEIKDKITDNNNNDQAHDHDKSIGGEMSSVAYVKEQIIKYPEVKYILRVLKRYFYYKKMNSSFLGGLSSYNLFLLLLSYAKYSRMTPNSSEIIENNSTNNKSNINLGSFLFNFLDCFKCFNFNECIIDINSPNIYNNYEMVIPEKSKEFNFGKSIVIIDPLTGVNASKSSYKIEEIKKTFSEASDFFYNEKIKYEKEGKTKISKNNNNKDILMGLPIPNKNDNNHGGGGNIIEKFLGKQ